jgi:hypothetical protein
VQIFKDATTFFSHATPNLATVIPAMDMIDQHLTTDALDCSLSALIHASLGLTKMTLNRYYDMTDHSKAYHIAMSA